MMTDRPTKPWELDRSRVYIMESFEAEVVGEDGDQFMVEFHDRDCGIVEATVGMNEFEHMPAGTLPHFGIVIWRDLETNETHCSAWPLASHWNKDFFGLKDYLEARAYIDNDRWRAAVIEQRHEREEVTALLSAHIFDTEEDAITFADLWIEANARGRMLLEKLAGGSRQISAGRDALEELVGEIEK
jgi:hypothetical protein